MSKKVNMLPMSSLTIVEPSYEDHITYGDFGTMHDKVTRVLKIYIAGPMRGYPHFNFHAFYRAEEHLKQLGYEVGNPARMDDESGGPEQYTVLPGDEGIRLAMERDLTWIAKNADAVYMLEGWEQSSGANAEWTLAKTLGLDIYYERSL